MIALRVSGELACSAERAWALVADYGQDPRWRAGVTTMNPQPPGIVTPGTTTEEVLRFGGRTYRSGGLVTSVDPGREFSWRTTSGLRASGGRILEPLDDRRTRLTLHAQVRPPGILRLFEPVLTPLLRRQLLADIGRLTRLV
ncbi:SRPBCC family protein [Amycolatopsis viridis]|uniref:Polyketide cyclase / dehydrase and lipid transport n=1 Tax=Amycolatopsis viridis TaxID=185678 RepID=A0ABX0SZ10_9PSEU|nr:SRPBCC family protein [Amycolatopsis viridis]NIH82197.1 hypothetical protein [Amycolatopsis viridis]